MIDHMSAPRTFLWTNTIATIMPANASKTVGELIPPKPTMDRGLAATRRGGGGVGGYLWDELAAATWIDPSITTKERYQYINVSTEHGSNYGDVLLYEDNDRPEVTLQRAHLQIDIDGPKLDQLLVPI